MTQEQAALNLLHLPSMTHPDGWLRVAKDRDEAKIMIAELKECTLDRAKEIYKSWMTAKLDITEELIALANADGAVTRPVLIARRGVIDFSPTPMETPSSAAMEPAISP